MVGHVLRVVNANGVPLTGALVWVSTRNGDRMIGVTSESGRIVLPLAFDEDGQAFEMYPFSVSRIALL